MWKSLLVYLQWFMNWVVACNDVEFSYVRLPGFKPRPGGCDNTIQVQGENLWQDYWRWLSAIFTRIFVQFFPMCPIWWICDHLRKAHVEPWQLCTLKVGSSYYETMRKNPGEHIEDIEANFREGLSTPRFKRIQDRWDILNPLLRRWLKQLPTSFSMRPWNINEIKFGGRAGLGAMM